MHFNIKANFCCTCGARHVANLIKLSRFLPEKALKIIDPVIMRNGHFAHFENIIFASLDDEREWIRQLGYMQMLHAEEERKILKMCGSLRFHKCTRISRAKKT